MDWLATYLVSPTPAKSFAFKLLEEVFEEGVSNPAQPVRVSYPPQPKLMETFVKSFGGVSYPPQPKLL